MTLEEYLSDVDMLVVPTWQIQLWSLRLELELKDLRADKYEWLKIRDEALEAWKATGCKEATTQHVAALRSQWWIAMADLQDSDICLRLNYLLYAELYVDTIASSSSTLCHQNDQVVPTEASR